MPMTGLASLLTFWGAPRDRARTLLDRRPPEVSPHKVIAPLTTKRMVKQEADRRAVR